MSLLEKLSDYFNLREKELVKLIKSAPYRYKVYLIPKKQEGEFRIIAQPSKEVKALQYWLIDYVLRSAPIHPCASAYKEGTSIKKNAKIHTDGNFLLKIDFKDFFPSIKPDDLWDYLQKNQPNVLTEEDFNYASRILFWQPRHGITKSLQLSIGAPSSPFISNIVMFEFDHEAHKIAMKYDTRYSRYADDLIFSTNKAHSLQNVYDSIEKMCRVLAHPKLTINTSKTIYSSKKNRRRVTGLIITNEGKISLGRERKRFIRSKIDYYFKGKLSQEQKLNLQGLIAFAIDVDPEFVESMKRKYSGELIDGILHPPKTIQTS
jgi:RNA-directed DNA polymerase